MRYVCRLRHPVEPLVRMATMDLLVSAGYTVREAADAKRALALLDAEPEIALMVTDVGLPRMNGHELGVMSPAHLDGAIESGARCV